jgi:hypothetical protein
LVQVFFEPLIGVQPLCLVAASFHWRHIYTKRAIQSRKRWAGLTAGDSGGIVGGRSRTRTYDPLIKSQQRFEQFQRLNNLRIGAKISGFLTASKFARSLLSKNQSIQNSGGSSVIIGPKSLLTL